MKDMGKDEVTRALQAKIAEADELIFIFPIWWGDAPAILKNFIDSNFTAGFAFRVCERKIGRNAHWKKAPELSQHRGRPVFSIDYSPYPAPLWNMNRIGFCGMKQESFTVFGDASSPKTRYQEVSVKPPPPHHPMHPSADIKEYIVRFRDIVVEICLGVI